MERDPRLYLPIRSYPINECDNVQRAYIKLKACQPKLENYPETLGKIQKHRFNYSWFEDFPWLEFSESKDKAFCFPCFLFDKNPPRFPKFTVEGFDNWKRVKGDQCAFANHERGPCSSHNNVMNNLDSLSGPSLHIDKRMQVQDSKLVLQNRLRLKATIECVKWLAMQACAFRGHNESSQSSNCGNFIEMLKYTTSNSTKSFEFCFLLFLLKEVIGITDCLCQVLQRKSQDIINALDLVSATICNLQKLRQDGWDAFIGDVTSFCISNKFDMPDMSAHYK